MEQADHGFGVLGLFFRRLVEGPDDQLGALLGLLERVILGLGRVLLVQEGLEGVVEADVRLLLELADAVLGVGDGSVGGRDWRRSSVSV